MNKKNQVDRFDYSKYESNIDYNNPYLKEKEFWGIYQINGRIQIDVERYKFVCESIQIKDFLPENLITKINDKPFIPAKIHKHDYVTNIFEDMLNEFAEDWNNEFKPIFEMIKNPKEVYDSVRLNNLAFTSSVDDLEDIEFNALMSSIKRQDKYKKVIQSLYCQFISKLATETDRIMLTAMCKLGYKGTDYDFKSFAKFSDGLVSDANSIKISRLEKYNAYNMLHKINNFLKHNTIDSYNDLRKWYPDNVASIESGTANIKYENGMFAGDWIIIKPNYIDKLINQLKRFFKDYCKHFVKENIEDAQWNYDDYFLNAYHELKDPFAYMGLYF